MSAFASITRLHTLEKEKNLFIIIFYFHLAWKSLSAPSTQKSIIILATNLFMFDKRNVPTEKATHDHYRSIIESVCIPYSVLIHRDNAYVCIVYKWLKYMVEGNSHCIAVVCINCCFLLKHLFSHANPVYVNSPPIPSLATCVSSPSSWFSLHKQSAIYECFA